MAIVAGRTRRQLRAAVLYNCGAIYEGTCSASGSTGTLVDNKRSVGSTDDDRGKYVWFTSGDNANLVRQVTASALATGVTTDTFLPVITNATANSDTFQLIGRKDFPIHPETVNEFINRALIETTGLAFDPEESLALHGDDRQKRFDVPSEFKMLNNILTRQYVESSQIDNAGSDWDEATVANVTRTVDTQDFKRVSAVRMVVASGASAGLVLASKAISSLDLRKYDYAEFWIKSTVATSAGDLQLLLDDTALCVSPIETLNVPALTANTWTYVRVALVTPALDSAIISVGLKYTVDIGAATIWINDVRAVNDSTATWVRMDRANWHIEEEARDIVFTFAPPSRLIKLVGGDVPALMTTDAAVTEIDDQFVIARATELTLLSVANSQSDPGPMRNLAGAWHNDAEKALRNLPSLVGVRSVA